MIEKLKQNDKNEYIALVKEFYSTDAVMNPIPTEFITDTFNELMKQNPFAECVVYRSETGKITGYMLLAKTWSQEGGGYVFWIEEIFVLNSERGKGVGSQLLKYFYDNYKFTRARLEVEPENENAVKLYKKFGFEFIPYQEMMNQKRK